MLKNPAASNEMGDDLVSLEFSGSKTPAEDGHFLILVAGKKALDEEILTFDVLRGVGNGTSETTFSEKLNKQSTIAESNEPLVIIPKVRSISAAGDVNGLMATLQASAHKIMMRLLGATKCQRTQT